MRENPQGKLQATSMAHEQQAWGTAICPLIPPTGGTLLISPLVTAALPKVPLLAAIVVGAPPPTTAGGPIPVAQRERVANENVPPPSRAEHQDSSEPIDTEALREEYKAIVDDLLRAAPDLAGRERPKCKGVRINPKLLAGVGLLIHQHWADEEVRGKGFWGLNLPQVKESTRTTTSGRYLLRDRTTLPKHYM